MTVPTVNKLDCIDNIYDLNVPIHSRDILYFAKNCLLSFLKVALEVSKTFCFCLITCEYDSSRANCNFVVFVDFANHICENKS